MNDEPRIDAFRTLLLILYAVLVAAGAWAVARRTIAIDEAYLRRRWDNRPLPVIDLEELTYVAARSLPANHRLTRDDLERPEIPRSIEVELPPNLIGRYTRAPRDRGKPVYVKDVAERPAVAPETGEALLSFAAEVSLVESGAINVDTRVEIWNGSTHATNGTVKAITGTGAAQRLIVAVAATDVVKIAQKPKDVVTMIVPSAR